jgi:hypothetical protein
MQTLITQPWYLFTKDLITFVFTATGLIIAGMGLAAWKKQIKGIKEFEAGYDLHYSLLKLRDAIKHVRNPAIFPSESHKAIQYSKAKYPDKSDEELSKDTQSYVYEMRWEEITEAFTEMESHLLAAEVLWGSEILKLIVPLNTKIIELNIALKQNFQPELRTKDVTEIHEVIYYMGNWNENDGDTFSKEVSDFIKTITDYIKNRFHKCTRCVV